MHTHDHGLGIGLFYESGPRGICWFAPRGLRGPVTHVSMVRIPAAVSIRISERNSEIGSGFEPGRAERGCAMSRELHNDSGSTFRSFSRAPLIWAGVFGVIGLTFVRNAPVEALDPGDYRLTTHYGVGAISG